VIAGSVQSDLDASRRAFDVIEEATPATMGEQEGMRRAAELVRDAASRAVRRLIADR
jgi:hypothetical protein